MPDPIYYAKSVTGGGTDNTLILDPRQGVRIPMNVIPNWISLRIGMFFSWTTANADNASAWVSNESVAGGDTPDNKYSFGIKTANNTLPGFAGANFIGEMGRSTYASYISNGTTYIQIGNTNTPTSFWGTCIGASQAMGSATNTFQAPSASACGSDTNYAAFHGLQISLNNPGLSTQTATISELERTISSDASEENLRDIIRAATATVKVSGRTFNDGAAALDRPTEIFVRFPFYNNRLRIHSIGAVAYET